MYINRKDNQKRYRWNTFYLYQMANSQSPFPSAPFPPPPSSPKMQHLSHPSTLSLSLSLSQSHTHVVVSFSQPVERKLRACRVGFEQVTWTPGEAMCLSVLTAASVPCCSSCKRRTSARQSHPESSAMACPGALASFPETPLLGTSLWQGNLRWTPLSMWPPPDWKLSLPESSLRGFSALPAVRACPSEKTWKCGCGGSMARCVLLLGFTLFFALHICLGRSFLQAGFCHFQVVNGGGGGAARWMRLRGESLSLSVCQFVHVGRGRGRGLKGRRGEGQGATYHTYTCPPSIHQTSPFKHQQLQ